MIHIEGNYYLDSDKYQFIVCEKKKRLSGREIGEDYYDPVAFCGNLLQLKDWLFTQELRDNLNLLNNLEECIKLAYSIDKSLAGIEKYEDIRSL